MTSIKQAVPTLLIIFIFLAQAIGLDSGGWTSYILLLIIICVYSWLSLSRKKKYVFPRTTFLLLLFLTFSVISTIYAIDLQNSIYFLFQYLVLSLVFIFAFNNQEFFKKILIPVLLFLSGILCLYSLSLNYLGPSFLPTDGYQLVYSRFGSHNHLGDFLVLPIIICLYQIFSKKNTFFYTLLIIFFLPFFFFSYSRSAYFSLSITASFFLIQRVFLKSKVSILPSLFMSTIIGLSLLFFLATVFESRSITIFEPLNQVLVDNFGLKFKSFYANRPNFMVSALSSIEETPFFGVGPGNFIYISRRFPSEISSRTYSSHNLFLDILTENGLFAFLCFLALILLIIKITLKDKSVYSLLFFALLLNFQTDYTFRISSLFILFFVLMGIIYRENTREE